MPIQIDESKAAVVVYCSDCGHWSRLASDRLHAYDIAIDHERRVHPGIDKMMAIRTNYKMRHAADS